MTQQPVETEQTLDNVWSQHKALLLQMDRLEEADLEEVRTFLNTLAQAGASVQAIGDRSGLYSLIRYWASFVDTKTGEFPIIRLQPFDRSLIRSVSGREQESFNMTTGNNGGSTQQAFSLAKRLPETPLPEQIPTLWDVPYSRNPYFTGRERLLEEIHHALSSKPTGSGIHVR